MTHNRHSLVIDGRTYTHIAEGPLFQALLVEICKSAGVNPGALNLQPYGGPLADPLRYIGEAW
jgi:hypothetical protein